MLKVVAAYFRERTVLIDNSNTKLLLNSDALHAIHQCFGNDLTKMNTKQNIIEINRKAIFKLTTHQLVPM